MRIIELSQLARRRIVGQSFDKIRFTGIRLLRSLGRKITIENCNFSNCEFPYGPYFKGVVFKNCTFSNTELAGKKREPIRLDGVWFYSCIFEDCRICWSNLTIKKGSRFMDCRFKGGRFYYSHIHSTEFSDVSINSELHGLSIFGCFGSRLSLAGSECDDSTISQSNFDELILPSDSDSCIWRSSWAKQSVEVFEKTKHLYIRPDLAKKMSRIQHENGKNSFSSINYSLLEITYDFQSYEDFEFVLDTIAAQPLDLAEVTSVFLASIIRNRNFPPVQSFGGWKI